MMKQDHNMPGNKMAADVDAFDNFLSNHLQQAQPYFMDDNFTVQVMAKLPAPKKLSIWQERFIVLIPLLIISTLVVSQFSLLGVLIKLWVFVVSADVASLVGMGLLMSIAAVSGASFWFFKQLKLN